MDISDDDQNCTHNYVKNYFLVQLCFFYQCVFLCMYVYECMYVCIYVCVYVCTYICMYECMYLCMYVCIYVCKYACIVVYVCGNCNWLMFSGVFGVWW